MLDEMFSRLMPGERVCSTCHNSFMISADDISALRKLRVSAPHECPVCRMRRRMAMMANIFQFYRKDCAEHAGEKVVSQMDSEIPYKIYDNDFRWDPNAWDATTYGRDYVSGGSFSGQLSKLLADVPHMAIARYNKNIINSDYTVDSFDVKNCYLSSTIGVSENVFYSLWVVYTKDSMDALRVDHVDHSYEVIYSDRIYKCRYIQNCNNCTDSAFLFYCHNCQNCFGCYNLRNKKYCFENIQLTQKEYLTKIKEFDLSRRSVVKDYEKKFAEMVESDAVHKAVIIRNSPGASGDHLADCRNCVGVYCAASMKWILTFYKNENVRYSQDIIGTSDSMDVTIFGPGELCYNVMEGMSSNKAVCSYFVSNCLEVEYCFECSDCKYCFGCSGLKKKRYCILNKQYTESEYWKMLDEIKTEMLKEGIYGDFISLSNSFFYYQDTYAQAMLPLSKEKADALGARWKTSETLVETKGLKILSASDVPDNIADVADEILNTAIICKETGKPFRIVKAELDFYRKQMIPVPVFHPQERLLKRFQKRNPYVLWQSKCLNCRKEITTTYDPARKLKVYCEECYHTEVM